MEAPGKLTSHTESERAERFYAQALLLVDCCKIPEAIRLLEQAIKLNPDCEIYRETLEFFQTSSFPGHLQSEQQGLSYANAARPKPNLSHGKENVSSRERKTKNAKVKESPSRTPWPPAAMASCHSNAYEESTINNPWTSFVNRNSKKKKTQSSPIDGISEIEIPPLNETFCNQSPSSKQPTMSKDGMSVEYAQGDHINVSADHCECEKVNYHEAQYAHSGIPDESLDLRFLEELCRARETGTDDWTKYYDVLRSGLREDVTFSQSDYLHHNTQTNHAYSGTLDEITDPEDLKSRSELGKDQFERSTSNCSDLCSKCGHLKVSLNGSAPPSPTKNRIHFVNGVCVSSSSLPNCTCSKQNKSCSEERSAKSHLSSSQQEFYSNLQHYFGSGKVKSRKEDSSTKSSELNQKSSASCSTNASSTSAKEPLNIKSKQNVTESTNDERKHERRSSKEDLNSEVTDDDVSCDPRKVKTSTVEDEVKTKTKSFVDERFQPTGDKQKVGDHDKVRSKTKVPTKTEQVKNAKEGMSQSYSSHRRHTRVKDRAKGSHKGKAEDISRPVTASETRKKSSDKQKVKQTPQVQIDFTAIFTSIYRTGVTVMSKCFQVFKSIMYYIFLLLVLVFGFLIYCVWFASCWFVKKVLHYTAADRWFPAVKSKATAMFEWIRARREAQRKTSAQGQTYDLPKNGDAAIRHMLQNKDSDPYSVLGVPSDATDDDIRKQYRKLAVLIHPDKNSHSQADEAFKILANAFDILSDIEKRRDYDREAAWKKRAEDREGSFGHPGSPEQFFADLGRKMQEMQNYLHCNQCDGKHRRYSTDRFILTARYCSRCNTRHAAKEGDLWAESSFLGYKLHFYACMEGEVYDVTEWAACQGIGNYRIEPNPHTVHLKLKTRQPQHSGFNSRSEEEDFENFMRAFFGQFNSSREERYHGSNKQGKRKRKKKR